METPCSVTDPIGPLREVLASRYEIQREIGQGAYATVYRALDLRHDRLVAIKVLNVDPGSDLAELRFVREIKWLARLQHPNILPLHDSGHVGNLLYFITPYLSGESPSSHDALWTAFDMVGLWPDSAESAVVVGRQVLAEDYVRASDSVRSRAHERLARELAFRGQLREAYRELARAGFETRVAARREYAELAALDILPPDSVRVTMVRWRRANPVRLHWLLPWLAGQHDTSAIRQLASDATSQAALTRDPVLSADAAYTIAATRAYLALATGDTAAATQFFVSLPDTLCENCLPDRLLRVQLLRRDGRAREASRYAREELSREYSVAYVLHEVEQARIAKQLGDVEGARRFYQRVLDTWQHPDPELDVYIREARDALGSRRQ